ncbi:BQ2448_216 [Microbotryum intermedium]|uniref:BQ2448_216 protein n=1 Tax=Microbotryum intermedium TaxID=269621 RepID=A0A238F4W6_9BASI|nr:BQ2448_216 [Microbotryum intermedium]
MAPPRPMPMAVLVYVLVLVLAILAPSGQASNASPKPTPTRHTSPEGSHMTVIRETIFVPRETQPVAVQSPPTSLVLAAERAAEPPANILNTVTKLKALQPLITYFIHHPSRLVVALAPKLGRGLSFIGSVILRLIRWLVLTLLYTPLRIVLSTVIQPFLPFSRILISLTPVWTLLLGALVSGIAIGVFAGLSTAEPTRETIAAAQVLAARLFSLSASTFPLASEKIPGEASWEKPGFSTSSSKKHATGGLRYRSPSETISSPGGWTERKQRATRSHLGM